MRPSIKKLVNVHSSRFVIGTLLSIIVFGLCLFVYGNLKVGLFFAALFIFIGAVKITETVIPQRYLSVLYVVWLIATAFVTLFLSQLCLNEVLPEKGLFVISLGILLITALFLILTLITLRVRISTIIVSAILIIFTCLNYFVFVFRGSEIAPADVLSIWTAGNVASEYSFDLPAPMFYALSLAMIYFFASYAMPSYHIERRKKARVICGFRQQYVL